MECCSQVRCTTFRSSDFRAVFRSEILANACRLVDARCNVRLSVAADVLDERSPLRVTQRCRILECLHTALRIDNRTTFVVGSNTSTVPQLDDVREVVRMFEDVDRTGIVKTARAALRQGDFGFAIGVHEVRHGVFLIG
ncbi:hypothetical protein BGV60_22320 [Burkholderia ubonensis]|nr:hypothetical protein BGV59_19920 [Burkholderia ubonensis]OJB49613.1 hypothetical protein BGV60_22320 [Burkholderia ubonensis]